MIDKYCVYIYSLHYVQREYIYHTTNRREESPLLVGEGAKPKTYLLVDKIRRSPSIGK